MIFSKFFVPVSNWGLSYGHIPAFFGANQANETASFLELNSVGPSGLFG